MGFNYTKYMQSKTFTIAAGVLGLICVVLAIVVSNKKDDTASIKSHEEIAALPPLVATEIHSGLNYNLADAAKAKSAPPIFLDSVDVDLRRIRDIAEKKATFFKIMLPIVARENDRVRAERKKVLEDPQASHKSLYNKYDVENGDVDELLRRIDVVPTSLVLAQAALESGWATSRFARHGNNFFGMRTYNMDAPGMDPHEAEGFKVMTFKSISASVRAYIKNLNTNSAYKSFRKARAEMRDQNTIPSGRKLSNFLTAYSEIPEKYGARLRSMMDRNKLDRFDGIRLADN